MITTNLAFCNSVFGNANMTTACRIRPTEGAKEPFYSHCESNRNDANFIVFALAVLAF